jgi:hypothetical protein
MDKILKKQIFISLIFTISFSCATTLSIDEQIEAIKKAPESKRVELMNQFKRQLVLMNQEERTNAIARLKSDKKIAPPMATDSMIERVQSGGIEQSIQMSIDISVQEEIQDNIKIPNIPNTSTPSIEQPLEIPTTPITQPNEIPNSQNSIPVEPSQDIPNTQSPPAESQEIPNRQTPVPITQPQGTPTTPSTQRVPNTPISNTGGI